MYNKDTNTIPSLSIIICGQDKDISVSLQTNIQSSIGVDFEIVYVYNKGNQYSIFEAYNIGVQRSKGEILCFQHNDIEYLSKDWGVKVKDLLSLPNVGACAVAGANYMRKTPSYYPIGEGYNVINLIQKTGSGDLEWQEFTEPSPMVVFDGLWFCIKKECFKHIHFDSKTYKGFHFYDIDISTQLIVAGYKIYGIPDVRIKHNSGGNTNAIWLKNSFLYADKWKNQLPISCRLIDDETSIRLEYKALYSALRSILLKKQFSLLYKWFVFAIRITRRTPLISLLTVVYSHRHEK